MAKVFGVKVTTPLIQINTSTPSVAGQVWTATDTAGNGSWQTAASGGGTVTTTSPVTTGKYTKWATSTSLTDSLLSESGTTVTVSGALIGSLIDKGGQVFNVKAYGAVGDTRQVSDGAWTNASTTVTSSTASFTSADVGKVIYLRSSDGSQNFQTTVATYVNATTITVTAAPTATSSGGVISLGTNDTSSINTAITNAQSVSGTVYFPNGTYITTSTLSITGQLNVRGEGAQTSRIIGGPQDLFALNVGGGTKVSNIFIEKLSLGFAINQSSGYAIHHGNVGNLTIKDVFVSNFYSGTPNVALYVEDGNNGKINGFTAIGCSSHGVQFAPLAAKDIVDFWFSNDCNIDANGGNGFHIASTTSGIAEGIYIGACSVYNNSGYACRIDSTSTGIIKNVILTGTILDSSKHGGIRVTTTTAYHVFQISLHNVWCSFNSNPGVTGAVSDHGAYFGPGVADIHVVSGNYLTNGMSGIYLDGCKNVQITGTENNNNGQSGGTGSGGANGTGVSNSYGITIGASTDNFIITGNHIYNDTLTRSDTYGQKGMYIDSAALYGLVGGNYLASLGSAITTGNHLTYTLNVAAQKYKIFGNYTDLTVPMRATNLQIDIPDNAGSSDAFGVAGPSGALFIRTSGSTVQMLNASYSLIQSIDSSGNLTVPGTLTSQSSSGSSFSGKITAPSLQINTATPSVSGQIWTATDTIGNASWQTSPDNNTQCIAWMGL